MNPLNPMYKNSYCQQIIEHLEDCAVLTTDPCGQIISWNASAQHILGYVMTDVISSPFTLIYDEDDTGDIKAALRAALEKGRFQTEKWHVRQDGSRFWGSSLIFPLKNQEVVGAFGLVVHDLTAQVQAKQDGQKSSRILESIGDAFFAVDHDWNFTYVNAQMEKIVLRERDSLLGKNLWQEFWGGSKNASVTTFYKQYHLAIKTRQPRHFEEYHPPLKIWLSVHAYPAKDGLSVYFTDITERKSADKTLSESEERLRFMAESMPQKIFTATADGSIDYFNPQWVEYTGMSFEQIRDWGWLEFVHPDDVEENVRAWKRSIKTGKPFQIEHRFRRADGQYRWHLSRAHAQKDEDGRLIMWIGSNTDIEDLKQANARKMELENTTAMLRERQVQLLALNDAKDEFIALASHQLRTPATGVKQYVSMLIEGYAGDVTPAQRDMLDRVYDSNERQLVIVNNLLNVASVDAGKVKPLKAYFDISQLLADVIHEQSAKFLLNQQDLAFKKPAGPVEAYADRALMRMVLENLIDNASKYSPAGKAVIVKVGQTKRSTVIRITDHGVGISKKDQDRLFQKFTRIDNALSAEVGGTGLGLYWAKAIIDLHDGQLEVESKSRAGSTFSITLPRFSQ